MSNTEHKCEICGDEATHGLSRCDEHYLCDDCGISMSNNELPRVSKLCFYTDGLFCHDCRQIRVNKKIAEFDGETKWADDVVCHHCGAVQSDSWEYESGTYDCDYCENEFELEVETQLLYSTVKT